MSSATQDLKSGRRLQLVQNRAGRFHFFGADTGELLGVACCNPAHDRCSAVPSLLRQGPLGSTDPGDVAALLQLGKGILEFDPTEILHLREFFDGQLTLRIEADQHFVLRKRNAFSTALLIELGFQCRFPG